MAAAHLGLGLAFKDRFLDTNAQRGDDGRADVAGLEVLLVEFTNRLDERLP